MWTGLGGPFIRDREPAIWAHPVAFSGSDLALTAPEIMPSSRHPPDRSFKGRVQKTRPCSFTARGLRSVAPKRAFPATNADVSVHRRSRLALSGSPRSVAAISEARCILGVFAPNSRRRERVPPSGLQRGCGNGLTVPEFGTACGGRRRRAKSVGSGETRWLQPRQRSQRLPRWQ